MIYGYARCSTDETKQDIKRQVRELKQMGVSEERIYFEYESGTKADRQQLQRLLDIVVDGDTIATTEVSRLTRSTKQLCEIIELVRDKHLKLIIGNLVIDCTTGNIDPMTRAMLEMMGVFAQLERNIISQRVKSGIANAKAKGVIVGRPQTTLESLPNDFIKHYPKYKEKQINVTEFSRLVDCSRQSIYKYLKLYENR